MSEFRLPRLIKGQAIVDKEGKPNTLYSRWWQSTIEKIEGIIGDISDILISVGIAQATADGGLALAQSAIEPGGTIKDDKVLTDSMVDNAATVISSLFYDNAGGSVGSSGSYVDLPGGPAAVSITTGTKATQQCFIKSLLGLRRGGGANEMVTLRCRREDGTILAQTYTHETTNDQSVLPVNFVDPDPLASTTHTYTIQINTASAGTQVREVFVEGFLGKTG